MTSTDVKDVRAMFPNQTFPAAGKTAAPGGEFQKVWNNQLSRGTSDSTAHDGDVQNQNKVSGQHSPREDASVQKNEEAEPQPVKQEDVSCEEQEEIVSEGKDVQEAESEVTEEQLHAMEVLGTAAVQLMEQIAEVFGITMEELQAVMDSLDMGQADLLDPSMLGNLLLKLGGAEDSFALLTDGTLYDNYRTIMDQLNQVLNESAAELGTEPEQLPGLLNDCIENMQSVQEDIQAEAVPGKTEVPEEGVSLKPEGEPQNAGNGSAQNSGTVSEAVQEEGASGRGTEGREQSGRQAENRADKGEQVNFLAQGFRTEQFRPEFQQIQGAAQESPWNAETKQIMDQILDYMKLSLNADATSLEMQLHPASLGTLQIQIASRGGVVTANFIAQDEAVKAALESQMIQLREQFEEQGVKVEAIEVTVQTHEFEQNLEQGRGRSQQETERRNRGRKIRLAGMGASDGPENGEMAEADKISAGGSTVSYTA